MGLHVIKINKFINQGIDTSDILYVQEFQEKSSVSNYWFQS